MESVIKEADQTLTNLHNVFSAFKENQINKVPFKGSWSAGQLAMHMILSNGGFAEIINGSIDETSRPADKMVERIKQDFLNFDVKMDAPEDICPALKDYDQTRLLSKLEVIKKNITDAADQLDLTKTCKAFELPGYGYLTRLEAIYFIIYHTKRHTHQLKNILMHVNA